MAIDRYTDSIKYLESFIDYEKMAGPYDVQKWKLERVEKLLEMVGNPHHGMRFIHVAGTKGKGSTSAMIASILRESGYKVGLYISPHLIDFRERISINEEMISKDQVNYLVEKLKPYVDILKAHEEQYGNISFFDVYTVLALLFFAQENVDFTVLEVGMGGRLDATNVVTPLVSVITQISYDHTLSLGKTIEAIAREKAGIIKDNGYVITSPQVPEALQVIENVSAEKIATLFEVGRDINYSDKGKHFHVSGILSEYEYLIVGLLGEHQIINAVTAIGAIETLWFHGFTIEEESIRRGLENIKWHARVEVIQRDPIIILDVAHNAASAAALRNTIKENFDYRNLILIFGSSMYKDIKGMGNYLCPIADTIILTKMNNPRSMEPKDIRTQLKDIYHKDFIITRNVREALEKALSIAEIHDIICITGSFYLAGEAMQALSNSYSNNDYETINIVTRYEGE